MGDGRAGVLAATASRLAERLVGFGWDVSAGPRGISGSVGPGRALSIPLWFDAPGPGNEPPPEADASPGGVCLPLGLDLIATTLGPWLAPTGPGCLRCYGSRRRALAPKPLAAHGSLAGLGATYPVRWPALLPFELDEVALRVRALVDGPAPATNGVLTVARRTLDVRWRTITPVSGCPCHAAVVPTPGLSQALGAGPIGSSGHPHGVLALKSRLASLVDAHCGPVVEVAPSQRVSMVAAMARAYAPFREGGAIYGAGKRLSRSESEAVAVLECFERYASARPAPAPVRGAYADLSERALDPEALVLTDDPSAAGLAEYDAEAEYPWVEGHSLRRGGPLLVPAQAVYGWGCGPERFLIEATTGWAVGSTFASATATGLEEVIERDGALVAWYRQLALPRVALDSADDPEVRCLLAACDRLGVDVSAFDASLELGVPTVFTRAETESAIGVRTITCNSGAGPTRLEALRGALRELVCSVPAVDRRRELVERDARRAVELRERPDGIRSFSDHQLLYALGDVADRFTFLDGAEGTVDLGDDAGAAGVGFEETVRRVLEEGLDVIVVDTTPEELARIGLCSVKVLVPGLLPLTIQPGRRVLGAARLWSVPERLGLSSGSEDGGVNRHPHPFH